MSANRYDLDRAIRSAKIVDCVLDTLASGRFWAWLIVLVVAFSAHWWWHDTAPILNGAWLALERAATWWWSGIVN